MPSSYRLLTPRTYEWDRYTIATTCFFTMIEIIMFIFMNGSLFANSIRLPVIIGIDILYLIVAGIASCVIFYLSRKEANKNDRAEPNYNMPERGFQQLDEISSSSDESIELPITAKPYNCDCNCKRFGGTILVIYIIFAFISNPIMNICIGEIYHPRDHQLGFLVFIGANIVWFIFFGCIFGCIFSCVKNYN